MKKLRETEATLSKLTGETIKVVEKSGATIKQLLIRSNAFQGPCSKPENCLLHSSKGNEKVSCTQNNFTYLIECLSCLADIETQKDTVLWNTLPFPPEPMVMTKTKQERDKKEEVVEVEEDKRIMRSVYAGESHRAPILRLQEHVGLYESQDKSSFMHKHWMSVHREDKEKPKFKAKVVRFHQRPMVRQLEEAVILWRLSRGPGPGDPPGPGIRILNSKSMYNRCSIKRLVLEEQESNEKARSEYSRKENAQNDDSSVKVKNDNPAKLPPTENSIPHSNKMYTSKGKTSLHTNGQTQQTNKSAETITKYFRRDKGTI